LVNNIFRYSVCIAITFGIFILNPFIVYTANNQNVFAITLTINNSYDRLVAQMNNYDSYSPYFHYVDSFSDLSRNATSSSISPDLFENDTSIQALEEDNNMDSNTEANSEDETTLDTNQSSSELPSSSSSSSDLLEEDNTMPTEEIEQDNINTEANSEDETTLDTNQPSSSSP
jgi:hypothetical protein